MIGKQSQKKKYPLVNWADGMPVNKGHFTQQEDHFTDRLCEYQSFYQGIEGIGNIAKGEVESRCIGDWVVSKTAIDGFQSIDHHL